MLMFFKAELSLYTFFWEKLSGNAQYVPSSQKKKTKIIQSQHEHEVKPRGGWLGEAPVAQPTHLKSTEQQHDAKCI